MRRHKYRAKRTTVDGITFASKKEAKRYWELCLLERLGTIKQLQLQVKYPIHIEGKLICTYIADFVYMNQHGDTITEDVKGMITPVYRIKKKLVEAIYKIKITET